MSEIQVSCLADSPVGPLTVASDAVSITEIRFGSPRSGDVICINALREGALKQLTEYFSGERREFDLPLRLDGTEFERNVWEQLQRIPYGECASYGEIARRLGSPGASRAVGRANHHNPISIVVPCHRVIGASGDLVGFGGGLPRKRTLLELEGFLPVQPELSL